MDLKKDTTATSVQSVVPIPFTPYYADDAVTIYNADCRQVLPFLPKFDLLLTDPPYGIGEAAGKNKSRANKARSRDYGNLDWDNAPPEKWILDVSRAATTTQIIFGGNYFDLPPSSGWLVWHKKDCESDFSDCELAWTNRKAGVRYHRHLWSGYWQEDMKNKDARVHPTQKPVALMRWCLSLVPEAKTVLDPFAGSGTTGVACKLEGRKATLIEISEEYCEKAADRLRQGVLF